MASRYVASPGWSQALRLVTGHDIDLRHLCDGNAMINPGVIVVSQDPDDGASLLMAENQGQPAIDRLVRELANIEKIMPALQAARTGLMDIGQLRQAAVVAERVSQAARSMNTNAEQIVALTSPSADGSDGEFRRSLGAEVGRVQQAMVVQAESLQPGDRSIAGLIDDAVEAVSLFGTRMARAFHKAQPELVSVATSFWDGANANLRAYWISNGWGPGGYMSKLFRTAPQTAEVHWRAAMAAYTSAGLPGLPAGTPTVAADLIDGWATFGVALSQRLGQTLDAMDDEANAAFHELSGAYRAVIKALGGDVEETDDGQELGPLTQGMAYSPVMPGLPSALTPMTAAVPASESLMPLATAFGTIAAAPVSD